MDFLEWLADELAKTDNEKYEATASYYYMFGM